MSVEVCKEIQKTIFLIAIIVMMSITSIVMVVPKVSANVSNPYEGVYLDNIAHTDTAYTWTYILYLDGDNNLGTPYYQNELNAISNIGSENGIRVVVLFDKLGNSNTNAYYVQSVGTLVTIPLSSISSTWSNEVNMGDPNTLISFSEYCINNYPAQHYLIIPQDHGGSWEGCCVDNTSSLDLLTASDLKSVFSTLYSDFGRKIDVVWFNDCLMSCVEIANQIYPYVDYIVGSETVSWSGLGGTWSHADIIDYMKGNPSISPQDLSIDINSIGGNPINNLTLGTESISSMDMRHTSSLISAVDTFSSSLKNGLLVHRSSIVSARSASGSFEGPRGNQTNRLIDLYDFANQIKNLVPDSNIQNSAQSVMDIIGPVGGNTGYFVMEERHTSSVAYCHGVSIYFPADSGDFDSSYSSATDFAINTNWTSFLSWYYDTGLPTATISSPISGQWFSNSSITVSGTASDADSGVLKVEISVDGGGWQRATGTTSWSISTNLTQQNGNTIQVRATDNVGNIRTLSPITVYLDSVAPSVTITNPTDGVTVSGTIIVTATASDNIDVLRVDFWLDGTPVCSDNTAPFEWSWDTTTASDGAHTLKAIAYDAQNNQKEQQITVNVNNSGVPEYSMQITPLCLFLAVFIIIYIKKH